MGINGKIWTLILEVILTTIGFSFILPILSPKHLLLLMLTFLALAQKKH